MQHQYDHIQKSPLYLIIFAMGILQLIAATTFFPWSISNLPGIILLFSGIFVIFLAFGFQHLQVVDQGDFLTIRFGKLPLPLMVIRKVALSLAAMDVFSNVASILN